MPVQPFQSQGSLVGFNEYKPNFIGRPVEALGSMIGKFDANNQAILDESNAMDLALSSIDLMPEDRKYLVEQRDKFRQGVQGIIDDENYNLAGARINKMAREFQGNEAIKASLGNKQTFEANRADLKKRYDDGKLDYQAYRRGLDQLYSPTLQDGDGFYSKFVPEEFVNKYDFDSILSKRTANWRPDLKSGPLTHVPATATVPEHYKTTTEELIRPEQVRSGLETALATDPDAMAYAEQVSRLNPEQYPDAQSVINAQIQSYVDKTALDRKGESYPGFGASLSGSKVDDSNALLHNPLGSQGIGLRGARPDLISKITTGYTPKEKLLNTIQEKNADVGILRPLMAIPDTFDEWADLAFNYSNTPLKDRENRVANSYREGPYIAPKPNRIPDNQEDVAILENILRTKIGIDTKLKDMSDKDVEQWMPAIAEYLEKEFVNEVRASVGVNAHTVSKNAIDEYLRSTTGEPTGLIKKNDVGELLLSGSMPNMIWHDRESGITYQAGEFVKALADGKIEGITGDQIKINPVMILNHKNPLAEVTKNDVFSGRVDVVSINGKEFYGANPVNNPKSLMEHKLYVLKNDPIVSMDISDYLVSGKLKERYGNTVKRELVYNESEDDYTINTISINKSTNQPKTIHEATLSEQDMLSLLLQPDLLDN